MMARAGTKIGLALASVAALTLTACGDSKSTPEGQVVATVAGKDVTIHELNAEISQIPGRNGAPRKLVEQVALQRLIERKMLVEEAKKRALDKNPQFLLIRQRADESLLVQALQAEVQGKVPATTREAAQKFVAENPQIFADRRIFSLDQIAFLRPDNLDQLPLKQANTMTDVERVLTDANIDYRRAPQQLDSVALAPQLTDQIVKLMNRPTPDPFLYIDQPPGAPAPVVFINMVTGSKTQPFTGERAIAFAQQVLQRQEVQKRLAETLKKWQEEYKTKIQYAKGFDPAEVAKAAAKPAAAGAKPAAGTAAPAPAAAAPAAPATKPAG